MTSILQKWCDLLSKKRVYFEIHKMTQGDRCLVDFRKNTKIYIVTQGCVKLSKIFSNNEILTLAILAQNDLINMCNAIQTDNNYRYLAEALSPTLIISCNYKKLFQQHNNYCIIYYELLLSYQRYIKKSGDMVQILSHRDKKSRLTNLLLVLSKQFGIITQFGIIINLNITHKVLAIMIGSNRITITKILNSLQKSKFISIYYNKILIHDPISLSLYNKNLYYFQSIVD